MRFWDPSYRSFTFDKNDLPVGVVLMNAKWGWLGGKGAVVSGLKGVDDRCAAMVTKFVIETVRVFVLGLVKLRFQDSLRF